MASLENLLTVQGLDTTIDQLVHRRAHLAQFDDLATVRQRLTTAEASVADTTTRLRAVRADEREAEDHASLLDDKATEVDRSLYDGSVTSHKELESLQEEHASLKVRQGEFEERAIELMELAEPLEAELSERTAAVDALLDDIARLEAEVVVAQAEIDAELERVRAERDAAAGAVDGAVLSNYDTLRGQLGGIAVARLVGARCDGCHLEIPSAQLAAMRREPEGEPVICPECSRMLVR